MVIYAMIAFLIYVFTIKLGAEIVNGVLVNSDTIFIRKLFASKK